MKKFICKICKKEFKSIRSLSRHINSAHKMKTKEYYDKYYKKKNEGFCIFCGQPTKYTSWSYNTTCGKKCGMKLRMQNNKKLYGDPNPWRLGGDLFKERLLEKYGVSISAHVPGAIDKRKNKYKNKTKEEKQSIKDKRKRTCIKRYRVENTFQVEENKEKAYKTKLKNRPDDPFNIKKANKTRVKNYGSLKESYKISNRKAQKTNLEKYGNICSLHGKEIEKKVFETRKKNGTLSKDEENFYKELCKIFKKNDIVRQYKEDRYPFRCDFYIRSLDLFIELNFHWTHGGHKYNSKNKNDKKLANKWKNSRGKYENLAYNVWTKRDIEKFKYAKKNILNYIVLYNKNEVKEYIKSLK